MEKGFVFPAPLEQYLRTYRRRTSSSSYALPDPGLLVTMKETVQFLREFATLEMHTHALTVMLYYGTPLDAAELIALERGQIVVSITGQVVVTRTSGRGAPQIPLDMETALVVIGYLERLPQNQTRLLLTGSGTPYARSEIYSLLSLLGDDGEYSQFDHFFPIYHETDYGVIPTPLRLNADTRYTGKGVTIAFIDSGFYPHPDLTRPRNRVRKYLNMAEPKRDDFAESGEDSWHGMQTSVSAAGNGYLSKGLYKGIAPDADVVLIKVRGKHGIQTRYIIDALEWIITHQEEFNIRIVNISLSGDRPGSYLRSAVAQISEAAIQAGIILVASAGNRGFDQGSDVITPPASCPSVITVGGLNDNNQLNVNSYEMYWSSYGPTLDGILKPEIVAPGIFVAAPILPGSPLFRESGWIHLIDASPDDKVAGFVRDARADGVSWPEELEQWSVADVRAEVKRLMKQHKLVAPFYQHVDGTSFSAPIVCSVIAQMLEANPHLTPARVKQILTETADKIYNVPIHRQGHGLIHPRKAVKEAVNDLHRRGLRRPTSPHVKGRVARFYYVDPEAKEVGIAGEWNQWKPESTPMTQLEPHLWYAEVTLPRPEWFAYKLVVDGVWKADPENLNREPDGYGGENCRVNVVG